MNTGYVLGQIIIPSFFSYRIKSPDIDFTSQNKHKFDGTPIRFKVKDFMGILWGLRIDYRRRESDLTLLVIVCTVRRGIYEDKHLFQEEHHGKSRHRNCLVHSPQILHPAPTYQRS